MTEGDGRRSAVTILISILALVLYFFLCSEPLAHELSAMPRWKTVLPPSGSEIPAPLRAPDSPVQQRIAFSSGGRFGYFNADGKVAYMSESTGNVAISDAAFIAIPANGTGGILKTSTNEKIAALNEISPFFISGQLFSSKADGTGVSRFDERGLELWSYVFPCQISAFASGETLSVGGTIDGWLEGIDKNGKKVFSFSPGGSRLPVVLGAAVSDSGDWIAAVSGIDKQRLVVLGRGGVEYRVKSHRYLESDFREPIRVVIMEDDKHVLYRRGDGVGVWSVDGKVDEILPVLAEDFDVSIDSIHRIALLAARQGKSKSITVFRTPSTLLGTIHLPDSSDFIRISGIVGIFRRTKLDRPY